MDRLAEAIRLAPGSATVDELGEERMNAIVAAIERFTAPGLGCRISRWLARYDIR